MSKSRSPGIHFLPFQSRTEAEPRSSRRQLRVPTTSICSRSMAATILAGSIGTLAMASGIRAAGAAQGNTLQNHHVPATAIDAASKTNGGVFSGRANRLLRSTPLDGDAFGINTGASAEHHVALSSRGRGRKLQDEDDDDQCGSAITVTSALFEDAEGCYEYADGLYYFSADEEHIITSSTVQVGTGTELDSGWIYGSYSNDDDADQVIVSAVCYYEDSDVPLDEIPNWECELDGGSVAFTPVSASDFSVSCGCSETPAPTGNGTGGEDTPAPSEGGTMTLTSEDTPAPSEGGTMTSTSEDTPTPSEGGTMTSTSEDTPVPSEGGTMTSTSEDTPTPSEGGTMTSTSEDTPAPSEGGTMTSTSEDTPAPSEGGTMTSTSEDTPAPSEGGTMTSMSEDTPTPSEGGTMTSTSEATPAPLEGGTMTSTSGDTPAPLIERGQTPAPSADSRGIGSMAPSTFPPAHSTEEPTPSTNGPTHSPHSPTHFADSSMVPTGALTMSTGTPTMSPTGMPTMSPTGMPTMSPTGMPTMSPTGVPSMSPTGAPTSSDRSFNSTGSPTASPSLSPTPPGGFDPANVGTLPFKVSTLGMVGASVAAIFVGLMPFVA